MRRVVAVFLHQQAGPIEDGMQHRRVEFHGHVGYPALSRDQLPSCVPVHRPAHQPVWRVLLDGGGSPPSRDTPARSAGLVEGPTWVWYGVHQSGLHLVSCGKFSGLFQNVQGVRGHLRVHPSSDRKVFGFRLHSGIAA